MQNYFSVLTIFPEFIESFFECGIIKKAIESKKIKAETINIRDFANNRHNKVDDKPYGGNFGMLMMAEPIISAIKKVRTKQNKTKSILLSPQGKTFNNQTAKRLSLEKNLILICGRYEGVDERIMPFVDEEISMGDFVMTGGEIPAMALIDSIVRFIPNVLGNENSSQKDSFEENLLKYSQYTRPNDINVPQVLTSGNHKKIEEWQLENSLKKTFLNRFDIFQKREFNEKEKEILKEWYLRLEKIINN